MLTITITTDAQGRITGLLVPKGAQAHIVPDVKAEHAFAAHFGAEGEQSYRYDEANDVGFAPHVPRGYRSLQHLTLHVFTED
jgi:hypothetical protein